MEFHAICYWRHKTPSDNLWRPVPGHDPIKHDNNLPSLLIKADVEAAVPDVAPFIAGAGILAYLRQLPQLGWTVPVNPFENRATMAAMHRTTLALAPIVLALQAADKDYRQFIPRWSHDREKRRDELEVRQHIDAGMGIGLGIWALRIFAFSRSGAQKLWAPMDIVLCGALTDLLHREYGKAHGF